MATAPIDPSAHLGLARHIAGRYASRIPGGYDEACAIANVALVHAAQGFDPAKGRWSTFAGVYIENALRSAVRAAQCQERHIRRLHEAIPLPDPTDPCHTAMVRADWALVLQRLQARCTATGRAVLADCLAHPQDTSAARAARLGCTPSAIRYRLRRLRRDLHAVWD